MCSRLGPLGAFLLFWIAYSVSAWIAIVIIKRVSPDWYKKFNDVIDHEAAALLGTFSLLVSFLFLKLLGCW